MFLKAAFLLLLALSAFAQLPGPTPDSSWTGTTTGAPTFLQPNTNIGGAGCAAVTTPATTYLTFNRSFTTSGVRQVILLAEAAFKGTVAVYLYGATITTPFSPTASCTNYIRRLVNVNFPSVEYGAGSLPIDDSYNFIAGTSYTFVVTSSPTAASGVFGLQIVASTQTGSTLNGTIWTPSNLNAGVCTNTGTNTPQNASVFTFQSGAQGYYDVVVAFEAGGIQYPSTFISIYEGSFTAAQIANGSCSPTVNASLVVSAPEGDRHAVGFAQLFKAFITYTAVVSTSYGANWGFQYFPTRGVQVTASGYAQPNRATGACTASAFTNSAFAVANLPAAIGAYTLVETNVIPSYSARFINFATYSFAYNGSLTTTGAPAACPAGLGVVAVAFTGNATGPLVIPTTAGRPYGVVISTNDGGSFTPPTTTRVPGAFVYVISPLANGTATTTGSTTGGASTTGGLTSTTTGNTTRVTITSTTDAAAIGVPMLLVAAAALLQLFM